MYGQDGGRGYSEKDRDRDRKRSHKDDDRDRSRKHRSRSRSKSRDKERRRSRSASRSKSPAPRPARQRRSLFDVGPQAGAAAILPGLAAVPGPMPVPVAAASGFTAAAAPVAASFGGVLVQPPSQQATRHARRVYVGGLPPTANEQSIATFFSHALAAIGGNTAGPGNSVVNVYINREKNFAFVEFRTVEETSNAMALDGIMFEGVSVRVRRPNDYNPAAAAALGPSVPNPNLNLAAIGLNSSAAAASDASERVFVGGLLYSLTDDQCRELLGAFGPIKSFDLVKDRETGQSKGYGFVVYADPAVTDIACAGLNGLKMGDRVLTVRRATESQPKPDGTMGMPNMPGMGVTTLSGATRVVVLKEAVTMEELQDDGEYNDILEDMRDECGKYGVCNAVVIPRPPPEGEPDPPGLGKVVIEFADVNAAVKARNAMHGRKFGGRTVVATYLPEEKYYGKEFDEMS